MNQALSQTCWFDRFTRKIYINPQVDTTTQQHGGQHWVDGNMHICEIYIMAYTICLFRSSFYSSTRNNCNDLFKHWAIKCKKRNFTVLQTQENQDDKQQASLSKT